MKRKIYNKLLEWKEKCPCLHSVRARWLKEPTGARETCDGSSGLSGRSHRLVYRECLSWMRGMRICDSVFL